VGKAPVKNDADIRFDRMRWGWFGIAISGVIVCLPSYGSPIAIKFVHDDDPSEEDIQVQAGEDTVESLELVGS
jgi:hypothetical protein